MELTTKGEPILLVNPNILSAFVSAHFSRSAFTRRKHAWQNVQYVIPVREKENVWPTTRLFVVSVAANLATLTNAQVVPFIKAFHITEITEKFPFMEFSKCLIQWNFRTFQM